MVHLKFAIHDSKASAYLPDWNAANAAVAIRLFQQGILTEGSPYYTNPGDYTLFEIGTYDQETGSGTWITPHIDHGNAVALRSRAILEQEYSGQRSPEPTTENMSYTALKPAIDKIEVPRNG